MSACSPTPEATKTQQDSHQFDVEIQSGLQLIVQRGSSLCSLGEVRNLCSAIGTRISIAELRWRNYSAGWPSQASTVVPLST
ncbi:conserved hypothetical protein, partial [Trichinella spiralis]|uniref:hypothetical protein n=1 Tax=Trichinella spiralis TaxID=6334 RepID=UPI0001EFE74F